MFTRQRSFQHCFDKNWNDNVPGHWKSNLLFRNLKHSLFLFWTRIQLLIVNYTTNVYSCYYHIELSRTSLCNQINHKKKMMHLYEVFPVKMNNKVYVIINVVRKKNQGYFICMASKCGIFPKNTGPLIVLYTIKIEHYCRISLYIITVTASF